MIRSAIIRYRPHRGDRRKVGVPRGVIYLPGELVGMEVKIVKRSIYAEMVKRLHTAEAKLNKINRITGRYKK